jgi:D-hydroxyproline dehydrogenase subunit beta
MGYDVVVVGSGIVGMACAWSARKSGRSVLVVDRDPFCVGASIRNFGFITVTGQASGDTWRRAKFSRDVWSEVAPQAGIEIVHEGLFVTAQRPEARAVLLALMATPEGSQLRWLDERNLAMNVPMLGHEGHIGALYSPHELRVEPRTAIPKLRQWLEGQGVGFRLGNAVQGVGPKWVSMGDETIVAGRVAVCPGPDLRSLFPQVFAQHKVRQCQLQMLRIRPPDGYHLPAGVMSDLSLVRYLGYAQLNAAERLAARLRDEQAECLEHGIHHYGQAIEPFASAHVEQLMLREMQRVLRLPHYEIVERWTGIYPSGMEDAFIEPVLPGVDVVSVSSGTGMSTAFGLANDWASTWQ